MKRLNRIVASILIATALVSCKKDETTPQPQNLVGKVTLNFQNNYQDAALILNESYTTPPPISQKLVFSRFSYIISDISLVKTNGEEFKYHHTDPLQGAFLVIHHNTQTPQPITLASIPSGEYTQIKFRLGISNEAWGLGQTQQISFWNAASTSEMTGSWSEGYRHTNFEGIWGENMEAVDTNPFSIKLMNNPAENIEHTIVFTLDLPTTLVLNGNDTKNIRFDVNASSMFGGKNKIKLSVDNAEVNGAEAELLSKIKENMFIGLFKAASVY